MTVLTVAKLGDLYNDPEVRARDGVQLAMAGIARGRDASGEWLPTIEQHPNGLDFKWGATVRVYQIRDGRRWRIYSIEYSLGELIAYGSDRERDDYAAWPVTMDTEIRLEGSVVATAPR